MDDQEWLVKQFEQHRAHLRRVAYRMLGSRDEAEDAVQESWLRLRRAQTGDVANLGGWLTTVLCHVCLDILRSRKSRREDLVGLEVPESEADQQYRDPAEEGLLVDSIESALLVVLETLSPAERVSFVLHDIFAVSFDHIARILDRSEAAARQLASRARHRVQGSSPSGAPNPGQQRRIVEAFLAASRSGDFDSLLALLSKDAVFRGDKEAERLGAVGELRGADAVAEGFRTRAKGLRFALLNGQAGLVVQVRGATRVLFVFSIHENKILEIEMIADPNRINSFTALPIEPDSPPSSGRSEI